MMCCCKAGNKGRHQFTFILNEYKEFKEASTPKLTYMEQLKLDAEKMEKTQADSSPGIVRTAFRKRV